MYLSLCLIIKDENQYLKEWLDYHILLGVDHFWIYDNESSEPVARSISEYIKNEWVTVNSIHGKGMQLHAYDHCIQTYGNLSKWIGFIDTDEFIVPKKTKNIPEYLIDFESFGGLALSSIFFGADGNKDRPLCGQVAGYLARSTDDFSMNRLIKSIIQPDKVVFPISPHHFMYREGNFCVNENKDRVDSQFFPCNVKSVQLNHYFTRSMAEWKEKMSRGRGDMGNPYSDQRWINIDKNSRMVDDTAMRLLLNCFDLPPSQTKNIRTFHDPSSTKFIDMLSEAAARIKPETCMAKPCKTIGKREELTQLLQDFMEGMDHIGSKRFLEAREIYSRLLQKYPFDLTPYTNLATACIGMEDFPAAWEMLAQAWRISPRNWVVLLCMVDYFYAIGNYDQAEKCSLLVSEYGNLSPIGVAVLALSQWKQGKKKEATHTAKLLQPQLTPDLIKSHTLFQEVVELINPRG